MGQPIRLDLAARDRKWFATYLFQLWFNLPADQGSAGAHDFLTQGTGFKIGNAMGQLLQPNASNATQNEITVTEGGSAGEPIAGSFSASWSNEGGEYGEVTGSFDFPCQ